MVRSSAETDLLIVGGGNQSAVCGEQVSETRSLFYLIGAPTGGKSTLFATLTAALSYTVERIPIAHTRYPGGIALGLPRPDFPGTDTLPMNAQPQVLAWLATSAPRTIIAEGDRLGNARFFRAVKQLGWSLTVAWLDCPWEEIQRRSALRPSQQNLSWIKGRYTKVSRLGTLWVPPQWHLDAMQPVSALCNILLTHEIFRRLGSVNEIHTRGN